MLAKSVKIMSSLSTCCECLRPRNFLLLFFYFIAPDIFGLPQFALYQLNV